MERQAQTRGIQWLGPDEAKIVTFSANPEGEAVFIGGQTHGKVYAGRIRAGDGSIHNVAIKRFNTPLSPQEVQLYRDVISDLQKAGVKLPKMMGMVELPKGTKVGKDELPQREWVQVTELLGSAKRGSRLVRKSKGTILSEKGRMEAALELTKVANSGWPPAADMFEPFTDPGRGIIVLDIDTVVRMHKSFGRASPKERADWLLISLEEVSLHLSGDDKERERLLRASLNCASPEIKAELAKILPLDNP
jgi:hypothetical protein